MDNIITKILSYLVILLLGKRVTDSIYEALQAPKKHKLFLLFLVFIEVIAFITLIYILFS